MSDTQTTATRHRTGHISIPIAWLLDENLRLADKGLLAYVLSHGDGAGLTVGRLVTDSRDGVEAVTSSIRRLEAAGYLRRERRRGADGKLGSYIWRILDPSTQAAA